MNHYQRGLTLRIILSILGFALAVESYVIYPKVTHEVLTSSTTRSNTSYNNNSSSWTSDYSYNNDTYNSGSGWNFGGGGSGWDNGGGGWDFSGGGDSGSWNSGGGDSGSW